MESVTFGGGMVVVKSVGLGEGGRSPKVPRHMRCNQIDGKFSERETHLHSLVEKTVFSITLTSPSFLPFVSLPKT